MLLFVLRSAVGPAAPRDTAERRHPPTPEGQAQVDLRPRCPQNCSRGGDCRRGVLAWDAAGPAHSVGEPSIRNLMATQIHTCSSLGSQCRLVWLCQSLRPAVESGDMSQVVQSSVNDACEEPLKDSGKLPVPWLPSDARERFGFRVSTCDEGISPTNWRQRLPRKEAFG